VDESEEGNDEQGRQERVALGSVGESFASGTGGVDGEHRWGRMSTASGGSV
jgi:hypothetical protein